MIRALLARCRAVARAGLGAGRGRDVIYTRCTPWADARCCSQVPGSLIVSKGYVDFVEVRARVSQEQFVGITTVKGSSSQGAKVSPRRLERVLHA